jgi:hypothetical protein
VFTRTTGFVIVPVWLAAMSWLVWHDAWPGLTADPPPPLVITQWLRNEGRESQFSIRDEAGERLGTIWSIYRIDDWSVLREDWVWLEGLPGGLAPARLFIESVFTAEGVLDEFTVRLESLDASTELHGERFHADFSFSLAGWLGDQRLGPNTFKTPLVEGGVLSAAFNPFSQLNDLHIGQKWRLQVFNPFAALTGLGSKFMPMLVRVTGEETIVVEGEAVRCFVVETPRARAWVDSLGVVRVQEIELPMMGRIRVMRESGFDRDRLTQISRRTLYAGRRDRS